MKSFLIKHKHDILHENEKYDGISNLDSRLLIQLSYDIAMGMRCLSRKQVMHGDLAARNILIGGKISDLSILMYFLLLLLDKNDHHRTVTNYVLVMIYRSKV